MSFIICEREGGNNCVISHYHTISLNYGVFRNTKIRNIEIEDQDRMLLNWFIKRNWTSRRLINKAQIAKQIWEPTIVKKNIQNSKKIFIQVGFYFKKSSSFKLRKCVKGDWKRRIAIDFFTSQYNRFRSFAPSESDLWESYPSSFGRFFNALHSSE